MNCLLTDIYQFLASFKKKNRGGGESWIL